MVTAIAFPQTPSDEEVRLVSDGEAGLEGDAHLGELLPGRANLTLRELDLGSGELAFGLALGNGDAEERKKGEEGRLTVDWVRKRRPRPARAGPRRMF